MAITKIHPIRRTLSKAVKYITNPKKTEEELYVSCFGCTRESLVSEFALTRSCADKESPVLAQHLIQSFAKDAKVKHFFLWYGKQFFLSTVRRFFSLR